MILIRMFRNGLRMEPDVENDSSWYEPEKALALLVGRLNGEACITSISTDRNGESEIMIDSPETNEHAEFRGHESFMNLLQNVCLLYIQARPHLCSESVRALVK